MATEAELFKQGKYEELWERCCGFIDLSLEDFMKIQKRLLLEQLELLKGCEMGRYILNGADPNTIEEFREQVPLTTYANYEPYLLTRNEEVLPEKPMLWQHTSGRSGEYPYKWVPLTTRQFQEIRPLLFALLFFSSCQQRKSMSIKAHDKFLYGLAPPPYTTGSMIRAAPYEVLDFLPPVEKAEEMSFEERIQQGFELALSEGLDIFFALSSVAVAIGDRFSHRSGNMNIRPLLTKPKILLRLVKGLVKSKLAGRPMLPRDIWSLKGLVTAGTDGTVYKEKIKEMWGRYPLDAYGCTESALIALQTWDYQGMTFVPHLNFFEFIPEQEALKSRADPSYQPPTILLDEVRAGENYELVTSNLLGGPLVRYRIGDMIKITSLRNEQLNIDIPQMVFHSRVDDLIDIAGFTRLTERVIWQAIESTGLAYEDWTARKEVEEKPALHLYLELGENGYVTAEQVATSVHQQLKKLDVPYSELESFIGLKPLEVTLLPSGAFQSYTSKQQAAGADLAHLKIPHINPSDGMIDFLVNGSGKAVASSREERQLSITSR